MISVAELSALLQVIVVDLVLAGDNAIVVGMVAATVMRVGFAVVTSQLLQIIGLTLAGGLLLLWVCWKLWREIMEQRRDRAAQAGAAADAVAEPPPTKTFRQAVVQIVIADASMS